jgi:ABC-type glutathione transport system ATPase component
MRAWYTNRWHCCSTSRSRFLDPIAIRRTKNVVRAAAARGTCILLSSHLLHLVAELCERIVLLREGQSVAQARSPTSRAIARSRAGRSKSSSSRCSPTRRREQRAPLPRPRTVVNAARRLARRLRQPRYFITALAGLAWLAFSGAPVCRAQAADPAAALPARRARCDGLRVWAGSSAPVRERWPFRPQR